MSREIEHISLLQLLSHNPLTLGELAKLTCVNSEAKLNVILNKLVKRGFLVKSKTIDNRNQYIVTPRGLLFLFYKLLDKRLKEVVSNGTKS
ncbi:hypothetical protein [Saccharolobus sp.]|uniref:hypothetical protein n=1 Tax=Saccharolobus sp. TaxID=2100761 RepID=UPI003171FD49